MLTASKLEQIIELEDTLRAEYQAKLDALSAEVERSQQECRQLQATVDAQRGAITELSGKAVPNQKLEQQNRELHNRSENMKEEVAAMKQRVKTLQREVSEEREQVKALMQYDPARMKKNLDANKKKLAEKTTANELLQKSLNKTKAENAELQRKVQELEQKLAELTPASEEENVAEEAAA
jgi:chromosome segregation ATPase